MGNRINWDAIPDEGGVVPDGLYEFDVEAFDIGESSTGKLMYKLRMRVTAPTEQKGAPLFDWFAVGDDEHPMDIVTSTIGAKQLKGFAKAVAVPLEEDDERFAASVLNQKGVAAVAVEAGQDGTPRNKVKRYYRRGERTPGVQAAKSGGARPGGASIPRKK